MDDGSYQFTYINIPCWILKFFPLLLNRVPYIVLRPFLECRDFFKKLFIKVLDIIMFSFFLHQQFLKSFNSLMQYSFYENLNYTMFVLIYSEVKNWNPQTDVLIFYYMYMYKSAHIWQQIKYSKKVQELMKHLSKKLSLVKTMNSKYIGRKLSCHFR